MSEVLGIKETNEALIGLMELTILLGGVLKDGAQATDVVTLYSSISTNEDLKAKFIAAYDNYKAIPAEIKDLSVVESVELSVQFLSYLPKVLESFKKA